jgi:hypothetical protein
MKMEAIVLRTLLGLSLLFNAVAFVRLRGREEVGPAAPAPAPRPRAPEARPSGDDRESPSPGFVPASIPEAAAPSAPAVPGAVPSARSASAAPGSIPAVRNDPQVRGVLEAQEDFGVFWKDLDRLFKARSKFDEAKYSQTVLAAVGDFLNLSPTSRGAFAGAVTSAASALAEAARQHDAAKNALPPKDKTNLAVYAAYQEQKAAVDLQYKERTRIATEGVKAHLDLAQPRHAELASNLEKLLKNLAPRAP